MQTEESSAKEKIILSMSDRIKTLYVNAKKMYQEHGAGVSIYGRNSARKTPESNIPVVSPQQPWMAIMSNFTG